LKYTSKQIADVDAFQLELIDTLPITVDRIVTETEKDTELRELREALRTGKLIHKSKRFNIDQTEFSL